MTTFVETDVAVIGAGPAGLMAAEVIAQSGVGVTVFDAMPSAGRKFLMAGRGGLNLTHSEPVAAFLTRYGNAEPRLESAMSLFSPSALRDWSAALGQDTFVGSSGRVFPRCFKASPLLRAWLRRLDACGARISLRHRWHGWDEQGHLMFDSPAGRLGVKSKATVLALGGGSWPRLGSDGAWTTTLAGRGVAIAPLRPANCGFTVAWSALFRDRFEGQPLKSLALSFGPHAVRGEAMITRDGLEGGAVYALSAHLREAILANGEATAMVSLRPDLSDAAVLAKVGAPRGKRSLSNHLRKALHLSPAAIGLLHEVAIASNTPLATMPSDALAAVVNTAPLRLTGMAPLAQAISTAGGIVFDELNEEFMLRKLPGVFAAGEMLDWEAPTGGYLLQASFSTGAAAGRGALRWIAA